MTATETVVRVLRWAADPARSPPEGYPADADALNTLPPAVRDAVADLARRTAADLGLPAPPFRDPTPLGTGVVLLALAVGVRNLPTKEPMTFRRRKYATPALLFADLAGDPADGPLGEWVVRHGLVGRAAAFLAPDLAAALLAASPLTAVLGCPPAGADGTAMAAAERVWAAPNGERMLVRELAAPGAEPAVRMWRANWLDGWRLRDDRRAFVLDVYEAALHRHRDALLAEVADAQAVLTARPDGPDVPSEGRVQDALSVASWWRPLAALARTFGEEIRARRTFGYDYLHGVRLFRLSERLTRATV